ncbi:MAG: tRNA (5-methylaminomethyl-2-thiouridine)(34)-methyltransferase MnmD [Tannerella sp.]|jgi:tRNA U34 5-methylaminomethyl-2-thiouridine-forming methyltransferase MnmC|nr:tRNA (5-methylaminomethyl-2-thiouridine)(34)-methyltransferase MnmD [Tannerella sp.]
MQSQPHYHISKTADGSHTLYVPAIDESFHSVFGAIRESEFIFIEHGLRACSKNAVRVLEIGFGTGLNVLLTALEAVRTHKTIHFTTLELYPLEEIYIRQLNYPEILTDVKAKPEDEIEIGTETDYDSQTGTGIKTDLDAAVLFEKIHASAWGTDAVINPYFTLHKMKADFITCSLPGLYDVVYFDAFSPEKQPEMWAAPCFEKIAAHCLPDAVLMTYCAKGSVRRALQQADFRVERLQGPPGKRECLRGVYQKKE